MGPRERMVASTALLVRERGARATSIDAVLEHSGAPRGSIYHHFPGGREQLLREATDYAGAYVADRLERFADDPIAAVDWLVKDYAQTLRASDYRAGCPVVAVAVESGSEPDLSENVRGAFDRWRGLFVRACLARGVSRKRADDLALLVIAAVEGAIVLCRAYEDTRPLEVVGRELRERLGSEL